MVNQGNTSDGSDALYPGGRDLVGKTSIEDLLAEYSGVGLNLMARWGVYEFAEDGRNIHREIIESLNLTGSEDIIDTGCGDGSTFDYISREHRGVLHALDISEEPFRFHREFAEDAHSGVEFIQGQLPDTGLPSDRYDVAMALFVLYHVPDPIEGISELRRLTKPEGTIVIATSGPLNKWRHREFEKSMAEQMGVEPPHTFAATFDALAADDLLRHIFGIENVIPRSQCGPLIIENDDAIRSYLASLDSMRESFSPKPNAEQWRDALETVVLPVIDKAIEEEGRFIDTVERRFYICKNRK